MRFRKLRIAWSVMWGLACVWIVFAAWGAFLRHGDSFLFPPHVEQHTDWGKYLYLLPAFSFAAIVPWLPWPKRFTLCTLLIATTLVAVVLGLIVWVTN